MKSKALVIIIILLIPTALFAKEVKEIIDRSYTLNIDLPDEFSITKSTAKSNVATYEVIQKGRKNFKFLISLIKVPELKPDMKKLKSSISKRGSGLLPQAVEKNLSLKKLKKAGYYYTLTDKAPGPGGYKYVMQGLMYRKNAVISFTFLYNKNSTDDIKKTLSIVDSITITYSKAVSTLDKYTISKHELNKNSSLGEDLICKSIQVRIFYTSPDVYKGILPGVVEKKVQSVYMGKEKGSIVFIRFNRKAEDKRGFFTGLFYGDSNGPTNLHPEEFIITGDLMVIFCFNRKSSLKDVVKNIVINKIKNI